MNVSWKQSSAASRPTEATRKRQTSSRWASRKRWNGGGVTRNRRRRGQIRETRASADRSGDGPERERGRHDREAVGHAAEPDRGGGEVGEEEDGAHGLRS